MSAASSGIGLAWVLSMLCWMKSVIMTTPGMWRVLTCLQAQLVCDTAGMVLDRLEEVQFSISRILCQHRRNRDRSQVIANASNAVKSMLQLTTEYMGTA